MSTNDLASNSSKKSRISSIDILRGLIMVLMAIDHVRVYSGIPANAPEIGIFFTRWITHFCAPGFAFLAGTSIYLKDNKLNNKLKLARQLVIRGLFLVFLELTVLHFFWAFNLNFFDFVLAGVIWMLGWCMVIMAGFIWLKPKTVGIIGISIILFQQLLFQFSQVLPESFLTFWKFIYPTGLENFQTETVAVLYVIVPWIGVMAAGYGFGTVFKVTTVQRKRICLLLGCTMIALFAILGSIQVQRTPESSLPFLLQLLNQSKYPASPLFLMMTLGPLILLFPFLEKANNYLSRALNVIGRVPLFYYLIHILLIHISALVVQKVYDGTLHQEWFSYAPFTSVPNEFRWSLVKLYFVFAIDVIILYYLCKWYGRYKSAHPEKKWLQYL